MPMYDLRCKDCGDTTEVLLAYSDVMDLVLVCSQCGGDRRVAPSAPAIKLSATSTRTAAKDQKSHTASKACGHAYACRCKGVKLTQPNPFRLRLDSATSSPYSGE